MRAFGRAACVLACTVAAAGAGAQDTERRVEGRVVRPAGDRTVPVAGEWVVIHRVARDAAGPLDSMRTRPDGSYAFRYRPTGDTAAVYFVSTSRGGVAYFTAPLRQPVVRGPQAELLVFDTTSTRIPIRVMGRHVIVMAPDTADRTERTIIEVYEISNDSTMTRVASADGSTFSAPLPPGVTVIQPGEGDLSPDAIVARGSRVHVTAPIAPGIKQFSFVYRVPVSGLAMEFLVEDSVPAVEVLIEDAAGNATGAGLTPATPVEVEGQRLKRFLARDVAAGSRVLITTPRDTRALKVMLIVTAIGTAMLFALGMLFMRRGPGAFSRRKVETPEALAARIAALDAAFENVASPTEEQRGKHLLDRAHLKGRLADALAKRDGLS